MKIHFEKGLQIENAQLICRWSNALGESFQKQWMGPKISYPLIVQSLQKLEGIFSIFEGTRVCGAYPENQARRQESSYREIFYQSSETGAGIR